MKYLNSFLLLVLIVLIAAVAYFSIQRIDRFLDNTAIDQCSAAYLRETTDGNQKITRPLEQQVRECAWQKGVRKWNGVWSQTSKE